MTEKMDWCRLGEVSAPYDELLPSTSGERGFPAGGEIAGDWLGREEGVSFPKGGDTDWEGVGGEW